MSLKIFQDFIKYQILIAENTSNIKQHLILDSSIQLIGPLPPGCGHGILVFKIEAKFQATELFGL